jgi:hypothetical protein
MPRPIRRSTMPFSLLCAAAILPALLSGCSSDDPSAPAAESALVGSWNVTSFATATEDFIAQGMTLAITFSSSGTYTLTFTNDLIGSCNPGPNCTDSGAYSATASTLTFDPGTMDESVFNFVVAGNTVTLTGSIAAIAVTITLVET